MILRFMPLIFVASINLNFLCGNVSLCIQEEAVSSSNESSALDAYSKMRVWFVIQSPDWKTNSSFEETTKVVTSSTSTDIAYDCHQFSSSLFYSDIPIDSTMWCLYTKTNGTYTGHSTYIRTSGGDSSKLHILTGTWTTTMYLYSEAFQSEYLTPNTINKIFEAYFPYRNSYKNGYMAYGLLEANVLDQYTDDSSSFSNLGHYSYDEKGNLVFLSLSEKIRQMETQYGSVNQVTKNFGGTGGLVFSLSLLVILGCFIFRDFSKKRE